MKNFLKYFLLTMLVLVLLGGIVVIQGVYRFDVKIHTVNNLIQTKAKTWGTMVNLIPDIFSAGEPFVEVNKALIYAGYINTPADKVWKYEDHTGKNKFVYIREANAFFCNINLYVFVEFDDNSKLKSAYGTQNEHGCL